MQKPTEVVGVGLMNEPRDIKLKSEESFLLFTWIASEEGQDLPLSILVSTSANAGTIFPSSVPTTIHKALFGTSRKLNLSVKEILCYIVACNSGEVLLIDIFEGGSVKKLCRAHGSVVWADFATISDCECLYLLERTGLLCIGTFSHHKVEPLDDIFQWQTLSLSMSPICCIKIESSLVLADGHTSYLCSITKNSKTHKWECKENSLPFWGVVRLEKKNLVVILTTCDGRVYRKTLLELTQFNETETSEEIQRHLGNLNLANIMGATKQCSEIIKDRSSRLSTINLYLEQLSIASRLLLNTPDRLLKVDLKIETSLEREGCYLLLLELQFNSQNFKLKGPWWQLSIKLKDCSTVNYIYNDINELYASNKARYHIYIPLEVVEKLTKIQGNYLIFITFDIVFGHFLTPSPVLLINAHQEPIDLIHFLTVQRSDRLHNFPFPSFKKSIDKLFSFVSSKTLPKTFISSHFKDSVLIFEKHLSVLQTLFPNCNSSVSPITTILWFNNLSVTLTCEKTLLNTFKIVLESSSKLLVCVIKIAIERRALQNYRVNASKDGKVALRSAILCNTNVCKLLLDLETSQTPSHFVVQRLYESVNNLISSIPL